MFKKNVKDLLVNGLLLFACYFQTKGESAVDAMDFESYLQPNEQMVFITPKVAGVIEKLTSDNEIVKDFIDYVKMGYFIAPALEVSEVIDVTLKSCAISMNDRAILVDYKQSLLNNDTLVEGLPSRRRKEGRFCTLFIRGCASTQFLNVRCNAMIGNNLCVGGTVEACNFAVGGTGCTGCTGTSKFNNISSCGNIRFNTSGTHELNAQGAFESFAKLIRGTIDINPSITGIILTPVGGPGTAIAVAGLPSAAIAVGSGFSVGPMAGAAFSSGISANNVYYIAVNLKIPVNFDTPYSGLPTIDLTIKSIVSPITATTNVVDANTATVSQITISDVTSSSAVINFIIHGTAQGATYNQAVANLQAAINNFFPSNGALSVNMIADGPAA